jgi:peptide methionine sulfoxide reductase MsrA
VIAGYSGGLHRYPTWHDMHDHSQALLVEYDPKVISYHQVLQLWRDNDDPWEPEPNVHFQSAIFCTSESQYQKTLDFLHFLGCKERPNDMSTATVPLASAVVGAGNNSRAETRVLLQVRVERAFCTFYQAEEYQQHYLTKQFQAAKRQWLLWANQESVTGLYSILE